MAVLDRFPCTLYTGRPAYTGLLMAVLDRFPCTLYTGRPAYTGLLMAVLDRSLCTLTVRSKSQLPANHSYVIQIPHVVADGAPPPPSTVLRTPLITAGTAHEPNVTISAICYEQINKKMKTAVVLSKNYGVTIQ